MRLSAKLPSIIVGLSVIAVCIAGVISFVRSEQALETAAFEKLEAVQHGRFDELEAFLKSVEDDVYITTASDMTIKALNNLQRGFYGFDTPEVAAKELAKFYVTENPQDDKSMLDDAGDGSSYSRAHEHYHPWFREFQKSRGYEDVLLLNEEGSVVYSVKKGKEFATNIVKGLWKDTDLATAFNAVKDKERGTIYFSDIRVYEAADNAPASFLASPMFDKRNNFMGVMVLRLPISRINEIMQASAGMGKTGEAYLVGKDKMMRSDSRFSKDATILKKKVDTEAVNNALAGKTGLTLVNYDDGRQALSAYGPIDFQGVRWAALAEITMAEVDEPVDELRNILMLMVLGLIVVIGVVGILIARTITRPVGAMTSVMHELANDNLKIDVPFTDKTDEIGEMATSVNHFKEQMIRVRELEQEQEEQKKQAEAQRRAAMIQMANSFEDSVGSIVETVTAAATQLQASASQMSATASETSAQATAVASASEEAAANVETVAAAAEELAASEGEISRHVHRSSEVADFAASQAEQTKKTVEDMVEEVGKIGAVVKLISDIAEQTNMLALNATIEAARAGDAGKGFAVVAQEVKTLANQTGQATEEIAKQIGEIQNVTHKAAEAIEQISTTITEIDEIASAIETSVEEQNRATSEIAENVDQASRGTQEVSCNIQSVQQAASETGMAATQISESSSDLSQQAEFLREEVNKFLSQVRSEKDEHKLIQWDENLRTGDEEIDSEHIAFVDLLNDYYSKMMTGDGARVVEDTMERFAALSRDHMEHEEAMMDKYAFPKADQHKKSHRDFLNKFLDIQANHEAGKDISVDFLEYLSGWLKDHFLNADKELVHYVQDHS
ncbi:bacteriohemerythrin [Terasakiella sp.]|uniref:bacteriohemerythrin n=1 Tax=Terasakiella sp. TaxID=2034861 RepID=UPI003AA7BC03